MAFVGKGFRFGETHRFGSGPMIASLKYQGVHLAMNPFGSKNRFARGVKRDGAFEDKGKWPSLPCSSTT
jgi:hypothetical protein